MAVHKRPAAGAKRQRGPAWAAGVPDVAPPPAGACLGQLAALLEFLQARKGGRQERGGGGQLFIGLWVAGGRQAEQRSQREQRGTPPSYC
jgi:hypothetical protein